MSVKQHEPICLDSAQDHFWWMDHFLGDQIQDEWRIGGTGTGVVVDQQTGGIIRLTTGALTNDTQYLDWAGIRSLHVDQRVSMEARVLVSDDDADIDAMISVRFDASNRIMFYHNPAQANYMLFTQDGGASTQVDSGVARDTSYHIYRIECHTHGANHIHFYIDGTECNNSPITTNIPDDATDFLQPYLRVQTKEDVAKTMDIDYCAVRQDR